MILDRLKNTREAQVIRLLASHPKVVAAVHWLRRPFIQHLILLILSTLVACCLGCSLLVPWHLIFPETALARQAVAPLVCQEVKEGQVERRCSALANFTATDHTGYRSLNGL